MCSGLGLQAFGPLYELLEAEMLQFQVLAATPSLEMQLPGSDSTQLSTTFHLDIPEGSSQGLPPSAKSAPTPPQGACTGVLLDLGFWLLAILQETGCNSLLKACGFLQLCGAKEPQSQQDALL